MSLLGNRARTRLASSSLFELFLFLGRARNGGGGVRGAHSLLVRRSGSCVTLVSRGGDGGSSPIASWRKKRLDGRPEGGEPSGVVGTRDIRWRVGLFSGVSNGLGDLARVRSYAGDLALFLISSTDTGLLKSP